MNTSTKKWFIYWIVFVFIWDGVLKFKSVALMKKIDLCTNRHVKNKEMLWTKAPIKTYHQLLLTLCYLIFSLYFKENRNKGQPLTRYWMPLSSKCLQLWGKRFNRTLIRLWYQAGLMVRKQSCSNTSQSCQSSQCFTAFLEHSFKVKYSNLLQNRVN